MTSEVAKVIEEKADEKLKEMKAAACDATEDEDELEEEDLEDGEVEDGEVAEIAAFESNYILKDNYVLKD